MVRQQIDTRGIARLRPPRVTRSQVLGTEHTTSQIDLLKPKKDIHMRAKSIAVIGAK